MCMSSRMEMNFTLIFNFTFYLPAHELLNMNFKDIFLSNI